MNTILIIVLLAALIMVVVSLVRGIIAFMQSTRLDLERDPSAGPSEMQLKQNQMMFKRIMYQGAAIMVVVVLLMASR